MIGGDKEPPLPMEGSLPPDLQGTLVRVGPRVPEGAEGAGPPSSAGALHAVELRDGQAV
jgi:carotenoid cleavage dioxygenase-like enzyme